MNGRLLENARRMHQSGDLAGAARLYREVLRADPGNADALYLWGIISFQSGRFEEAERQFGEALAAKPEFAEALNARGAALSQMGRHIDALASYDKALAVRPNFAEAYNNRGNALAALSRHEDAVENYRHALAICPDAADASYNCAIALLALGRPAEAFALLDKLVEIRPNFPGAIAQRAAAHSGLRRFDEALEDFGKAIALDQRNADTICARGNLLLSLGRIEDAFADFDQALALRPDFAAALNNRGVALSRLGRPLEALASYTKTLAADPDNSDALYNRGNTFLLLSRYQEAAEDCARVLARAPDYPYARGVHVFSRLQCCDWRYLDEDRRDISEGLAAGRRVLNPQQNISISRSEPDQLQCARLWVADQALGTPAPLWRGERYGHEKIRIAYVSADYHVHATAWLIAGLIEQHDRLRFEIAAVSLGPDDGSEIRARLKKAFDSFVDAEDMPDHEIAERLRRNETDIAVDLKGYTAGCRPGIFARRPAPVQVNYLGFPGTMGTADMDYILADRTVIPDGSRKYFTESVAYLPDTYQCNDERRKIAERIPSRAQAGLPERGFVFCCFNASYKIAPEFFDIWMRFLHSVDGSVLWLLERDPAVSRNLRREAEKRDIAPERIVFAPLARAEDHLARHRLADLFIDTLPYCAHTTASDALWAGLPLVTCMGTTFAGRVAASLLRAAGMPELVTASLEDYERRALHLARNPQALAAVKAKLSRNRQTMPLFDSRKFARNIEAAYLTMWARVQRNEAPDSFAVEPLAAGGQDRPA